MSMKEKNALKKTYWGLLEYKYTEDNAGKEVHVFGLETAGEECCYHYEDATVLYETKKEALRNQHCKGWQKEKLVKFTTEIVD